MLDRFYRGTAYNATHGIAMRMLSVYLSVRPSDRLSNACFVAKRKKPVPTFLTTWKISRNSATTFLYVNTASDRIVRHLLAYLSVCRKWFAGVVPFNSVNFFVKVNHPLAWERMRAMRILCKQQNTTHISFASQVRNDYNLQCSIKFITTPIN